LFAAFLRCLFSITASAQPTGTVYLVLGSDTAIWNAGTTVDVYTRHPHYSQDSFTDAQSPSFQVMDAAWRDRYRDSYGQTIKFTWWMMGGNIYRDADNLNVPLANTMTLYLMQKYHGDAIRTFGDEVSLHYHTFRWNSYNADGEFYWNQTPTFNECREDFDVTLAQYLLEGGVYPVSFRSGWHFMDNDWQNYLNQLLPFCLHDDYGAYRAWYTNTGPIAGVEDWSRAPSAFLPFHPSTNDYQVAGDGKGWNVRSVKMQNLTQADVNQLFSQAAGGEDQVACIWDHLPENFVTNVARVASLIQEAASNNPAVPFRYCTAVEAMQRWLKATNLPPPQLEVNETVLDKIVILTISTSGTIFQDQPFVCLRDAFQNYTNLTASCVATGPNRWRVVLPLPRNLLAKVGVAVTDSAGNLATRILRYLPDDLFLDNLDPEYTELQGSWASTNVAAWGIDARVCLLSSNETARAQWLLPISRSGRYNLSVQVPHLPNMATNLVFNLWAGPSNVASAFFSTALSTNQWVCLGSPRLDQTASNLLEMVVSGTNQPRTYALADVVRVRPLADAYVPDLNQVSIFSTLGGFALRYNGVAGWNCAVQRSTDLGSSWTTLATLSAPLDGFVEYEDNSPPPQGAFYRVAPP
jgi:hypothetical protein